MAYAEGDLKKDLENKDYEFGFVTDIESEKAPKGLNKEIIQFISQKKKEPNWLLAYRLKAFEVWSKWMSTNYLDKCCQDSRFFRSNIGAFTETRF